MGEDCIDECKLIYPDDLYRAYFIDPISNGYLNETCYCLSTSQFNEIIKETDSKYDDYCFDVTNSTDIYGYIDVYTKHCH